MRPPGKQIPAHCLPALLPAPSAQAWLALGFLDLSTGTPTSLEAGVSAAGNPVVVVCDVGVDGPRTRVLEWVADSWALLGDALPQASQASLAVAPDGGTYMAYTASDAGQQLRVLQLVDGQWQAASAEALPTASAASLTLQAASGGELYLACILVDEATSDPAPTVLQLSSSTWQFLPSLAFDPSTPMRLTAAGAPLLLGFDAGNDTCLMALSGGAWEAQGPCIFSMAASASGIAVTPSGALLVAYSSWDQGDLRIVQLVDSRWEQVGDVLSAAGSDAACQLVAASDAVLVAACTTSAGQGPTSIWLYDGTAAAPQWTLLSMAGLPAQLSQLRLAVTRGGTLFAAYSDGGSGGVASVRQYAQQ